MVRTRVSSKLLPQLLSRPVDHVPGTFYRTHCTGYIVLSRPVDHHTLHTVSRTTSSTTDDQHQWWPNTKLIPQSPSHVSYRIFPKQQGIGLFTRVVTNFYSSALSSSSSSSWSSSSSSSSSWSCEWCWQVLRQKWRIPSPLPLFTFLQHNHHHRQHHHED